MNTISYVARAAVRYAQPKFIGVICISLLLSISGPLTYIANAKDVDFFADNDILFYDPDSCQVVNSSGDVAVMGNDIAEKIFRFLTTTPFKGTDDKPFNSVQAAGALGNFFQESSMNPGAIERLEDGSIGEGRGLAQWSTDRRVALFNLATTEGQQWSDFTLQLKMIRNELNSYEGDRLRTETVDGKHFKDVTTPVEAAYVFQKIYERAGKPVQEKRDKAAIGYYEQFEELAPGPTVELGGSSSAACAATTGTDSSFIGNNFVIYNQFDSRWAKNLYRGTGGAKTIGEAGCGPSAMAMAITALTGQNVTPADTTAYANTRNIYIYGEGSTWNIVSELATKWGLKYKDLDKSVVKINEVLRDGGLVITSGKGAAPFTEGGHIIVIRGVTSSGKWKVGDSNGPRGQANSEKEWDPVLLLDIINEHTLTAVTK